MLSCVDCFQLGFLILLLCLNRLVRTPLCGWEWDFYLWSHMSPRGINGWLMEIGVLTQRRKKEIDVKGRVSIGVELSCRESQDHNPSNTYTFLLICFPDCAKKSNTAKWQCQLLFQWQTYYVLRMLVGRMENMSVKSQINRTKTLGSLALHWKCCLNRWLGWVKFGPCLIFYWGCMYLIKIDSS